MVNMGDCPTLMLNAPVPAAKKALAKAGLTLGDIDLFEINEAFAVVAEKFIRDLDLDRDKVNVNGGAMALGHPIGATGSMLIGTMLDELERRDLQRGLVTMGGMAGDSAGLTVSFPVPDPIFTELPSAHSDTGLPVCYRRYILIQQAKIYPCLNC